MTIEQNKLNEIIVSFANSLIGKSMNVMDHSSEKDVILFLRFKYGQNKNYVDFKIFNDDDGEITYWIEKERQFLEHFKIQNDYDEKKIVELFFKTYTHGMRMISEYKYEKIQIHFSKAEDGFENDLQ